MNMLQLRKAGFVVFSAGTDELVVNADQLVDLLAVCLADEHFGYDPDFDWYAGGVEFWYCRDSRCSQPFGSPHIDACQFAASIKRVEAMRDRP